MEKGKKQCPQMLPEGKGTGTRAVEAFSFTFIIFYGSLNFYYKFLLEK